MSYSAPIQDLLFDMEVLGSLAQVSQWPGCEDATLETSAAILEECAKLAQDVIAPLNRLGDTHPSEWKNGQVTTTAGFRTAFEQFTSAGWQGIQHPSEYGGQQLPKLIATACVEMINAANISFSLCPLLTDGAIEALLVAGSDDQKNTYIPKFIAGQWTGTMNLTEPQAGSDLAQIRTRAEPQGDGTYKIFGTKIFITYGDHDLAENIIHMVLARVPGAPEGVKGISLFLVPKFLVQPDGSLGSANDVTCVSIEHKLGIKASPTAVMQYGDRGGAIGTLIGEENRGLEYMFIMMNAARFGVGVQGIGVAERAYQQSVAYAKDRVQSRPVDGSAQQAVAIIHHPDVRRMLMTSRALTEAARSLAIYAAYLHDASHRHPDISQRQHFNTYYEWLVPLVKGFSTEMSLEVTSLNVQIHGGMGFIEETGAAQHYRDARILPIYEGTTAIQANDLIGRKTLHDKGALINTVLAEIQATLHDLENSGTLAAKAMCGSLILAKQDLHEVVQFLLEHGKTQPNWVYAGSVPYLMLTAYTVAGWLMARSLLAAEEQLKQRPDDQFLSNKVATCRFYAHHLLPRTHALATTVLDGAAATMMIPAEHF